MRTRFQVDDWKTEFEVTFNNELFNPEQVSDVLDIAGGIIGVGDWRPKFGRFSGVAIYSPGGFSRNSMKRTTIAAITAIASSFIFSASRAHAQTCDVIGEQIPANQAFLLEDRYSEPAYIEIDGSGPGERVNIRSGPGLNNEAIAYSLTGNFIWIIGQAFDSNCETWIKVYFPLSGVEGWIYGNFVSPAYARGWWT